VTQLVAESTKKAALMDELRGPKMLEVLRRILPKGMTPERFVVIVQTEIRKMPALLDCDRASTLAAFLQAAKLGLEPGVLGQCWCIPFGRECVLVTGYRGLAQLAWRSGMVTSMSAHAVFQGDIFDYEYGARGVLKHKPGEETDPLKLTHAYCTVDTIQGGTMFVVHTRKEIESRKARSRAGKSGPWVTDYAAMACKTAVLSLMKLMPLSVEMQTALSLDEAADTGDRQPFDVEVPELGAATEAAEERQPGEEVA